MPAVSVCSCSGPRRIMHVFGWWGSKKQSLNTESADDKGNT